MAEATTTIPRRKPYRVTVRRMANGCDYRNAIPKIAGRCFRTMARHVRWLDGIPVSQLRLIRRASQISR
jgi:hypothetical protein